MAPPPAEYGRLVVRPPSGSRFAPEENVIVGRLIPAGTGMEYYRNVRLSPELEQAAAKVQEEVSQAYAEAERALELLRQEGEAEELAAE